MTRYKSKSRQKFGLVAAAAIPLSLCASIDAAIWHVDDDAPPGGNAMDWLQAINDTPPRNGAPTGQTQASIRVHTEPYGVTIVKLRH